MSKQIKIASYSLFQTKIVQINEWMQVSIVFLDKLIWHSFLSFLNKVLEFLNFVRDLVLVSYKPVSYKKACIPGLSLLLPPIDFEASITGYDIVGAVLYSKLDG